MTPRLLPDPARLAGTRLLRLQSDERLVALVRDGHEAAFAVLVDRYQGQLERYAERIVGPSRAEDVVQQAFVNAHRGMLRDDRDLALKAWLHRITHNAALNVLRKDRDEVGIDEEDGAGRLAATATATADVAELRARLRETLDAIAALPAPQRDAIVLRELEGRSHEEIALALGITAGAARQQVMRARISLRAAVSALTPYPLLAHAASSISSGTELGRTAAESAAVGGAGAGAVLLKLTAGVATTGALASTFAVPALREQPRAEDDRERRTGRVATVADGPPAPARAARDVLPAVVLARAAARPADGRRSRTRADDAGGDRQDRDEDGARARRSGPGPAAPSGGEHRREGDRERSGDDRDRSGRDREDDERSGDDDRSDAPDAPDAPDSGDDRSGSSEAPDHDAGDSGSAGEDDTNETDAPEPREEPEPDAPDPPEAGEDPDDPED